MNRTLDLHSCQFLESIRQECLSLAVGKGIIEHLAKFEHIQSRWLRSISVPKSSQPRSISVVVGLVVQDSRFLDVQGTEDHWDVEDEARTEPVR